MAAVNRSSNGLDWGNTTPYATQQDDGPFVAIQVGGDPDDDFVAVDVNRQSGDFTFTTESALPDSQTPNQKPHSPAANTLTSSNPQSNESVPPTNEEPLTVPEQNTDAVDQREILFSTKTCGSPLLSRQFSHSQTTPPPTLAPQPLVLQSLPPSSSPTGTTPQDSFPLHQRRPSGKGDPTPSSPTLSASNSSSNLLSVDPGFQLNLVEEKGSFGCGKIFDCLRSWCGSHGNKSKNT